MTNKFIKTDDAFLVSFIFSNPSGSSSTMCSAMCHSKMGKTHLRSSGPGKEEAKSRTLVSISSKDDMKSEWGRWRKGEKKRERQKE